MCVKKYHQLQCCHCPHDDHAAHHATCHAACHAAHCRTVHLYALSRAGACNAIPVLVSISSIPSGAVSSVSSTNAHVYGLWRAKHAICWPPHRHGNCGNNGLTSSAPVTTFLTTYHQLFSYRFL